MHVYVSECNLMYVYESVIQCNSMYVHGSMQMRACPWLVAVYLCAAMT
jgi:hypothetical protein